jgi:nucleoside-diphosphate-sugar epimerase
MKVLVTGSKGFVGKYLVAELKNRKHTVVEFDLANGKNILDKAGVYLKANPLEADKDAQELGDIFSNPETFSAPSEVNTAIGMYAKNSLSELNALLESAVQEEDYEKAAKIRDEISKR